MDAMMTKSQIEESYTLPARIAWWGGSLFILLLSLLHMIKPELDPSWHPISEYALGNFGWVMTLAFFAWGIGMLATVLTLRPQVKTRVGRIGLVCLAIGALGPILAGIFPTDPITTSMEAMTTTGMIHGMGAVLGDGIAIGGAMIAFSLSRNNLAWQPVRGWLLLATVVVWVIFVWLTVLMMTVLPQHSGMLGPEVMIGWPNRLLVVAYALWSMVAVWGAMQVDVNAQSVS